MRTNLTPADRDRAIAGWKAPYTPDASAADPPAYPNPAGDVRVDDALSAAVGGDGEFPKTTWVCVTIVSAGLSCGQCDSTLWKGTCGASTIGCCPEPT